MNLVVIAAFIAVCGAAKLDRTYLPPSSAASAGGSPGSLQAPGTRSSEQGPQNSLPSGSYTNNFEGVVVDAASSGTRSSEGLSGLGGPRPSYGSSDSKVGDAAFRGSVAGFRGTPTFGAAPGQISHGHNTNTNGQNVNHAGNGFLSNGQIDPHSAQGFLNNQENDSQIGPHAGQFSSHDQQTHSQIGSHSGQFSSNSQSFQGFENKSERPQAAKDRNSNILALSNDVNTDSYSYGFETDNGIVVGENGVAVNGIQAEGGYSYQGDDGQVYKVTYTADEGGYRPQGAHLPTPPPIPEEILKSLEQNAKEEAAGLADDGSYDAQKYNTDGDYTHDNGGNNQFNGVQLSQFEKRPESDATAFGTFNNQNSQAFEKPGSTQFGSGSNANNPHLAFNGQSSQASGNTGSGHFGAASNAHNSFSGQLNGKPGQFEISGSQSSLNAQSTQINNQPGSPQFGSGSQYTHSSFGHSSHGSQFDPNSVLNVNAGSQSVHSSKPLNGNHGSSATGQTFEYTGTPLSSSSQSQGSFGSQTQSHLGQHVPASSQLENLSSASSSQQTQQQSSFGQGAGNFMNSHSTQPQFGSSFKPQGSEAFSGASLNQEQDTQDFGKPSPQIFSGHNFNRPSSTGNINNNKQRFGQSQMNFESSAVNGLNRIPQSPGRFGAQNEYIPPLNSYGKPKPNKSESSGSRLTSNIGTSQFNSNGQENGGQRGQKDQNSDFEALNRSKPGLASASASTFGQLAFQPQPDRPLNAFNTQKQSKPIQFSQKQTTQFNTNQLSSQTPAQFNSNSQQSGSLPAQSVPDFGSKPTAVPDAELTTPLEPNETPTSQGSQFSSQTTSSFGSFGSKPASSSQTQSQFGFKGNTAVGQQSTSQTLSPNFPTSISNTNSQYGTASTQSAIQSVTKGPENSNGKLQFSQNSFSQTQQNQGIDDSYYYNQPSKSFGTPLVRPQGSRFPSAPSYQSNGVVSQNQFSNQQSFQSSSKFPGSPSLAPVGPTLSTQFAQTQGYNGITQAAISSFPAAAPTLSSQFSSTQNGQFGTKPSFNGQSTFGNQAQSPGAKPSFNQESTFANQGQIIGNQENTFPKPVNSRLPIRPQLSQKPTLSGTGPHTQFGQSESTPEFSDGSSQQQTLTQQYSGTIYEYNKPAEVLPAPAQTDSSSSQTIQTTVTSESKPSFGQPQGNQLTSQQNTKPFSHISQSGSENAQNKPFSSVPHSGQHSQTTQQTGIQFGSQPAKPAYPETSTNIEFGQTSSSGAHPDKPLGTSSFTQPGQTVQSILSSNSQQNAQDSQTAQTLKPFGSASPGIKSPFGSKPQFGGQTTQFSQTTQSFGSFQSSQPQKGSISQSQFSSQTSQDNGYFYPGNPKPQFSDESKNHFNQNSQTGRPRPGSSQYQNAQSGSTQTTGLFNQQSSQLKPASKPQSGVPFQGIQNTQTTFSSKAPNSPILPFNQPQVAQPTASSQAFASGQATASASASSSPQEYKPFGFQDKTQFSQTEKPDQSGQGTQQFVAQNLKPFGSNIQENDAPNSTPFGASVQGSVEASKPLFNSPCCQGAKDSTPAQSTDRPNQASFQGTQSFNGQSFAGKGEQFGGPRQPPSFDEQTGYHY